MQCPRLPCLASRQSQQARCPRSGRPSLLDPWRWLQRGRMPSNCLGDRTSFSILAFPFCFWLWLLKQGLLEHKHTSCMVLDVTKRVVDQVATHDQRGPAGRRCFLHGGHVCNIPGCGQQPRFRVREADGHGPAGHRCMRHGRRVLGPKQCQLKTKQEALAPASKTCSRTDGKGWRCTRPAQDGRKFCMHHMLWRKREIANRGKKEGSPTSAAQSARGAQEKG